MTDSRTLALLADTPGDGPAVAARAPGRVNLIGEHTDYNGLPVLPIAIDRDVLVVARRRSDDAVELSNADPAFTPRRYSLRGEIPPFPPGDWGNYHKAAAAGLRAHLGVEHSLPGGSFRVHGAIPVAAGLSSSSALTVACGVAHLALADVDRPRLELAELFAHAERYVGTLGGGMDQAATLLSEAGHALHIDFFPLRTRPVPLPPRAGFVVAHSLQPAEKSGRVRGLYNQRVVECRLACALLTRRTGVPASRLADFPDLTALLADLAHLLPEEEVRAEALPDLLGVTSQELHTRFVGGETLAAPGQFALRRRVRHVLGEAERVAAAEQALRHDDLAALGELMNDSHRSCAEDYEVSTPALDQLAALARAHGALGARLTGAGFGGAIVALVERDRSAALIAALDRHFYATRGGRSDLRLAVEAGGGAVVERLGDAT